MLKSRLCNYSDAYILDQGRIAITGTVADAAARQEHERNKGLIFENCAPFTKCISQTNNTQLDDTKHLDILMPMYNLIEYNDYHSSGSLNI